MTEKCCERFFELPAGCYCGLYIREDAAKKLQKILWRQTQEIREFLTRNMDALEASNWTLAYAGTKNQTILRFYDGNSREDVPQRIVFFGREDRLTYVPNVFKTDLNYLKAIEDVRAFYVEHYGPDNPPEGGDAT